MGGKFWLIDFMRVLGGCFVWISGFIRNWSIVFKIFNWVFILFKKLGKRVKDFDWIVFVVWLIEMFEYLIDGCKIV